MISFAFSASLILIFTVFVYRDTRTPIDTRLLYKYRVKDDSIFRRIIPFKDRPHYPCCYFKVIPIYLYLCIAILGWLLSAIDVIGKGFITNLVHSDMLLFLTIATYCVYFLYFISVTIWWGVIDHRLTKITTEEKGELKQLRKTRKMQSKNDP